MSDWGVKHHTLRVGGKLNADIFVDDKAISDKLFFNECGNLALKREKKWSWQHKSGLISDIQIHIAENFVIWPSEMA